MGTICGDIEISCDNSLSRAVGPAPAQLLLSVVPPTFLGSEQVIGCM